MKRFFELIKGNRLFNNISWIFFGNVAYAAFKFLLDALIARFLSLNDNGMLNYANSIVTFITVICGLGFSSIITREFVEDKASSGKALCSCIVSQSVVGLVSVISLQFIIRIISPDEPSLYPIVLLQSLSSIFSSLSLFVYWFRYKNQAKLVAILRIVAFVLSGIWRLGAVVFTDSLIFYTIGLLSETIFFGAFLLVAFFKTNKTGFSFSFSLVKKILKSSYPFIFSALLTTIYGQTDKVMLKSMMDNEAVALYSVALHLAVALSMIPSTLIEGFRPEVMELKFKNEQLYLKRFRQLYAIIFWVSVAYGLFVTVFAKQIILILYGEKYLGAVGALSLVVWYSAFSYFGSVNNMYMVSEYKAQWVQITTLAGAICNVILNYLMIPYWGIMGAALASLLTQFVANFLFMWIVKGLRPGFYNMLKGITLRDIR